MAHFLLHVFNSISSTGITDKFLEQTFCWAVRIKEKIMELGSMIACDAGVLLGRANVKARIVYPSGHIWFGVRVDDGG